MKDCYHLCRKAIACLVSTLCLHGLLSPSVALAKKPKKPPQSTAVPLPPAEAAVTIGQGAPCPIVTAASAGGKGTAVD